MTVCTDGMNEIFENYLAIALGEKPLPRKRGLRGVNRQLFRNQLTHYGELGRARPRDLLGLIEMGDPHARQLLISACVAGWRRQWESAILTESEGLINV